MVEEFYERMKRDGVGSNLWTFAIAATWKLSQDNPPISQVLQWTAQEPEGIELYNILLSCYRRRQGKLDEMLQLFHEIRSKVSLDSITYQVLVEACFENQQRIKALAALRHMKEAQIQLTWQQWKHLSQVCQQSGFMEESRLFLQQALQMEKEQTEQRRCYLEQLHQDSRYFRGKEESTASGEADEIVTCCS